MTDAGYVLAGFLVTAGTVAAYAAALRARLRRVERTVLALRQVGGR
jgi:hypothetical protein